MKTTKRLLNITASMDRLLGHYQSQGRRPEFIALFRPDYLYAFDRADAGGQFTTEGGVLMFRGIEVRAVE